MCVPLSCPPHHHHHHLHIHRDNTHTGKTHAFLFRNILVEFNIRRTCLLHGRHCQLYSCAFQNQGQQLWTFVLGENSRGEFAIRSNYPTRGLWGLKFSRKVKGLRVRKPGLNPAQLQLWPKLRPVTLITWASDSWHKWKTQPRWYLVSCSCGVHCFSERPVLHILYFIREETTRLSTILILRECLSLT